EWDGINSLDLNNKSQVILSPEKWQNSSDGSCSFKAAVSGDNLLMSIEVTDGQILTEEPNNDNVAIYYGDLSSNQGRRFRGGTINIPAQQENGTVEGLTIRAGRSEIPIDNTIKSYYKKSQNGYTVELSVPFQTLGFSSVPAKGSETGFEVVLTNAMKEGNSTYQIGMSGTGSEVGYSANVFNRFEME
ncbi:MAG TPA: sugar-binding protein, partial [Draconibacterium sp.]|nr:sugar-binding protein [Draconibacterium sp.]